jgi:hypothetical protein
MEYGCKLLDHVTGKCLKFTIGCKGDQKDKSQCPIWVEAFALENALENYYNQKLEFEKGKTEDSGLHPLVIQGVRNCFPNEELIDEVFSTASNVILYGEGYGPKVNGGGKYRKDHSFILFDVLINGKWWLDYSKVKDIAEKLSIDVVPSFGMMTTDEAINLVKTSPQSMIANCGIEGLVLTPEPVMLFNNGTPIKTKVKVRDYR